MSKLAERVVCNQLMSYLMTHDVLCPEQHGFRPAHSTESALLDAVSYISTNRDEGRSVSLIAADAFKAFDSVEHGRLLEKLGWYGISQHWFQNWLSDRVQIVRGGSVCLPVTHGVVQGSILGPVLFSLFINDLASHVPCEKLVMYADDTQFLNSCERGNLDSHQTALESVLDVVQTWFHQNSLKNNPTKTELVVFGATSSDELNDFSISFAGASVRPSPTVKIIRVVLDCDLRWEAHVSQVVRRCYATLSGLAKLSNKLPTMDFRPREALFFGDNFFKLVTTGFKFSHHPFQPKRRHPSIWSLNPRPAGVWLVTRPAGGGGAKGPPLISPKLLDRFPNFKLHSIALYVNYPYKVKNLTRRSLMTSQVRSKSEFSTFRAW